MKKKIMALMIVIPLILMLTIFSVGKAVSVVVDIPVSGIHIITQSSDGIIMLDMAHYSNDIYIFLQRSNRITQKTKITHTL